jgi:hypothetical protein
MVREGRVKAEDGSDIRMEVQTICLHGDSAGAVRFAKQIRAELEKVNVEVKGHLHDWLAERAKYPSRSKEREVPKHRATLWSKEGE